MCGVCGRDGIRLPLCGPCQRDAARQAELGRRVEAVYRSGPYVGQPVVHGHHSTYSVFRCRCKPCRRAHSRWGHGWRVQGWRPWMSAVDYVNLEQRLRNEGVPEDEMYERESAWT